MVFTLVMSAKELLSRYATEQLEGKKAQMRKLEVVHFRSKNRTKINPFSPGARRGSEVPWHNGDSCSFCCLEDPVRGRDG